MSLYGEVQVVLRTLYTTSGTFICLDSARFIPTFCNYYLVILLFIVLGMSGEILHRIEHNCARIPLKNGDVDGIVVYSNVSQNVFNGT